MNRFFPCLSQNLGRNPLKVDKNQNTLSAERFFNERCVVFFSSMHIGIRRLRSNDIALFRKLFGRYQFVLISWFDLISILMHFIHKLNFINDFNCDMINPFGCRYHFAASKLQKRFFVHFVVVYRIRTSFEHTRFLDEFRLDFKSQFFQNKFWRQRGVMAARTAT